MVETLRQPVPSIITLERGTPGFDLITDRIAFYAAGNRIPEELQDFIPADVKPDEFFIFTISPEDTTEALAENYRTTLHYIAEANVVKNISEIYEERLVRLNSLSARQIYQHVLLHEEKHVQQDQEYGITTFVDDNAEVLGILSPDEVAEMLELSERAAHQLEISAIASSYTDKTDTEVNTALIGLASLEVLSLLVKSKEKVESVVNLDHLILRENRTPWDFLAAYSGRLQIIEEINTGVVSITELETLVRDTVRTMLGEPEKILAMLNGSRYQAQAHDALTRAVLAFKDRVTTLSQLYSDDILDMQSRDSQT